MAVMPGGVTKQGFVPLEPFVHQVGGKCPLWKFDDGSVCKPLKQKEHRFYEEQPSEMRPFTPEYRGVVYVSCEEDEDGKVHLTAHPDKLALECQNSSTQYCTSYSESNGSRRAEVGETPQWRSQCMRRLVKTVEKGPHRVQLQSGKLELVSTGVDSLFEVGDMSENSTGSSGANPWSVHCHKEDLNKIRTLGFSANIRKFIVLEDVVYKFSIPCILDLKMGTQYHGDDTTSEKRDRQIAKVEKSTSKILGVRASGMQVYKRSSGRFMCRDKHYGMKLCEAGFREELVYFLHDGQHIRTELIEPLLYKLRKLYKVIEKQNSFRFYSSSLLLMYEGDVEKKCDGAPNTCCTFEKDQETRRKQDGNWSVSSSSLNKSGNLNNHICSCNVDLRMIDFVHTTHGGFSGDCMDTGPDSSYLFGLKNLIRILEEIQNKYQESSDSRTQETLVKFDNNHET